MAESTPKTKKRLVKNPETFRERAVKAVEASDKPTKKSRVWRVITAPFKFVFRPIKRFVRWLVQYQPFKFIAKIFHWVGLVLVPPYIRHSWKELKLVTWPSWKQSRQLTFAVLVFAFVFGALVFVVDLGLDKLFRQILLK